VEEPSVAWFSRCSSGPCAVETELDKFDKRRYAHGEERDELQGWYRNQVAVRLVCHWTEAYNESLYMTAFPASLIKQVGHVCN
jgi:hypothetical protein